MFELGDFDIKYFCCFRDGEYVGI